MAFQAKLMHYPDWYQRISEPFRGEAASHAVNILDRGLVAAIAVAYVLVIMAQLATAGVFVALRLVVVPALAFVIVSYLRDRINAPRPYELFDIDPIIHKDTRGKSMPSRHVASAVAIACALAWVHLDWGVIAFVASAVVVFTRIVGGVHFPRDVAAAVAISAACGFFGFVLL